VVANVVGFLEDFFDTGLEWDEAALAGVSARLTALAPSPVAELNQAFTALARRVRTGEMNEALRREVEAVVYPRMWKVLEAAQSGLPEGEQRARVDVLNRRLARLLAPEADQYLLEDPPGAPD
jgi:hypothetical protein